MTDHKFERETDRQVVLDDFKRRIIDLMDGNFSSPATAWDEAPIRYYKLNLQWVKVLAGVLDIMEDVAFWKDAQDENYAGIQGILNFEEGIELPDFELDCDEVELCLATSETINNLISLIENQQSEIDDLEEALEHQKEDAPIDSVDLPPLPDNNTSANAVCRSANFVASQLTATLLEAWEQASSLSLYEFVSAFLGVVWWDFTKAKAFWAYTQTLATPTLGEDAAAYEERIQQAYFCAQLSHSLAQELVLDDSEIPELEKALWLAILDNYKQSQINEWAALGELQETEPDCTDGCSETLVWDFAGTYEAEGEETIYSGDLWEVTGGEFIAGKGYSSTDTTMTLFHELPEQCRVAGMHVHLKKNEACGSFKHNVTWRGTGGTGAITQTADLTSISDIPHTQAWDLDNALLPSMTLNGGNHTCILGGTNRDRIEWIRMFVSGATPTA